MKFRKEFNMENQVQETEVVQEGMQVVFNYSPDIAVKNVTEEVLTAMEEAAKTLPDATTPEGLKNIKERLAKAIKVRTGADKYRETLKKPALDWSNKVQDAFNEIKKRVQAVEAIYKTARDAETTRLEAIAHEEARVEAERIAKMDESILKLQEFPAGCIGRTMEEIGDDLATIENFNCTEELFGERYEEAVMVRNVAISKVRALYDSAKKEKDQAELLKLAKEADFKREAAAKIDQALNSLAHFIVEAAIMDSAGIQKVMTKLSNVSPVKFGDRAGEAKDRIDTTMQGLKGLYEGKLITEKAAAEKQADDDALRIKAEEASIDEAGDITPEAILDAEETMATEHINPVIEASQAITEKTAPGSSRELMSEETYNALAELVDENNAGIIIEALTAQAIPHVSVEWVS